MGAAIKNLKNRKKLVCICLFMEGVPKHIALKMAIKND